MFVKENQLGIIVLSGFKLNFIVENVAGAWFESCGFTELCC